jgi:hypothetical protein
MGSGSPGTGLDDVERRNLLLQRLEVQPPAIQLVARLRYPGSEYYDHLIILLECLSDET